MKFYRVSFSGSFFTFLPSLPPSSLPSLPSLPPSLKARNWIKELKRMLGDKVTLCIVGNKIDLDRQRTVTERDALE